MSELKRTFRPVIEVSDKNVSSNKSNLVSPQEEALYEKVVLELANCSIKQGLWLKSLADNDGDENKAKAHYAKNACSTT